jgi:hypothetical protein
VAATLDALNTGRGGGIRRRRQLKNITAVYGTTSQLHLRGETPRRVDVAGDRWRICWEELVPAR